MRLIKTKEEARKRLEQSGIFTPEWELERKYYHKKIYVRYELLAEEYEALKKLFKTTFRNI